MNIWRKFEKLPDYMKKSPKKSRKNAKKQWDSTGDLKKIRVIDARYIKR